MPRDDAPKSKLIRLLQMVSRGTAPRIGLVPAAQAASVPAMALVIALDRPDPQKIAAARTGGADAVVVAGKLPDHWDELSKAAGDEALGIHLSAEVAADPAALKQALALQPDFVIADAAHAPASLLSNKDVGLILSLDESYPAQSIRALGELRAADVLANLSPDAKTALTVKDMLFYRQVVDLVHRPVIVSERSFDAESLEPLRDMGVEGIILHIPAETQPDELTDLVQSHQKAIAALGRSIGRGRDRGPGAIVPRIGAPAAIEHGEEPEEE